MFVNAVIREGQLAENKCYSKDIKALDLKIIGSPIDRETKHC